ncbi:neurotrypsin-like [Saccostrea cucullata]|uniref:neurotrypsin-like n=1 Tax=Saccostrea cuccullata TaxID=36930 RepID=UPI002ED1E910
MPEVKFIGHIFSKDGMKANQEKRRVINDMKRPSDKKDLQRFTMWESSRNSKGTVRLVNGTSPSNGRVEVYYSGVWGTICDDDWDDKDAGVICVMLGYSRVKTVAHSLAHFGEGTGMIWLDDVECYGNETDIEMCSHSSHGFHNCRHSEDAGVSCSDPHALNGLVRLVDGSLPSKGRLEVYYSGIWGTVCGNNWGSKEAGVVCAMMGYPR